MALWRVDIENVSTRYLEAASIKDAVAKVKAALVADMSVSASPADRLLRKAYAGGSQLERRALLLALDSLHDPKRTPDSLKRKIELLQRELEREEQWLDSQLRNAPPVSSERLEAIGRLVERNRLSTHRDTIRRADAIRDRLIEREKPK